MKGTLALLLRRLGGFCRVVQAIGEEKEGSRFVAKLAIDLLQAPKDIAGTAFGPQAANKAQHLLALARQYKSGHAQGLFAKGHQVYLGFVGDPFSKVHQLALHLREDHRAPILPPNHRGQNIYHKHVP
ncbi:hypothetical protein MHY01S_13690 [Meiothermus hypogaeus NBRC 106114]|uniref:Uncharacterized protein n=1 Tax=Meiothermus hypogaeus NBRC 106114 TaxID=1227553 RepID=A0A511R0Q3_9DEIN|nr:hypothetical protein MHY01S_13690 [Meiothermus hypogaeus NBRC 106114]